MNEPETPVQDRSAHWARPAVQVGFLVLSLLVGWQFHRFALWLADPSFFPPPERPPSVEAWLPISNLMSLTCLLRTGEASPVHPAGLVLFNLILALTILAGRGFCSWVCPIGTLSEWAHRLGKRLFGRNLDLPPWADIPLRGLKFLLLAFFLYAILGMPALALKAFLDGPYNRIADVKMYLLFAELTRTTAIVLVVLLVLSVAIRNFWCRYLCPYGALLGLAAWFSPVTVRRDVVRCTNCKRCETVCPNRVAICAGTRVRSLECTTCYSCVKACPVPGTLDVSWPSPRRAISMAAYATLLVVAFALVAQTARSAGYWETNTPPAAYVSFYRRIQEIGHPRTPRSLVETGTRREPAADLAGDNGLLRSAPASCER
jgi:polyferredoxin